MWSVNMTDVSCPVLDSLIVGFSVSIVLSLPRYICQASQRRTTPVRATKPAAT